MFEDKIALGRAEDLAGKRFGKLVALYRSKNIGKDVAWKCQCDCGNVTYVRADSLKSGSTKSCGCSRGLDITNKRSGKLVALEPTDRRSDGSIVWKCQCDCGNITYVSMSSLTNGKTKSCGCSHSLDITNKRSGKLVALEPTNRRNGGGSVVWKCQCDCGNIAYISMDLLNSGKTKSCGCLKSHGEETIIKILVQNNIVFDKQYSFETCRFPNTNALARFDFYINDSYLLEYDGSQHFFYSGSGWDTKENFMNIQQRDEYKNQWCKENNIPLIRIPYTKLDTLCIEDLLLETTQFRIV